MRPLFPSDLRNDVVIACEVMNVDPDCSPEITAMIGAAAAPASAEADRASGKFSPEVTTAQLQAENPSLTIDDIVW